MKYIDKATHQLQGNQIVDNVLEISWVDDQNQYINANYDDGLCNNQEMFYQNLTIVLLENQESYCCYCMKQLDSTGNTTLEHIIPHKVKTQEEFDNYIICDELNNNVIYSRNFDRNTKVIPPEKYPHDIAYYNLLASCDSNAHCNHYRSNKPVYPLFYDSFISDKVDYNSEGIAYCEEYQKELIATGISTNADLKGFRKVWKILAERYSTIDEITNDEIDTIILELVDHAYFEKLLNNLTGENNNKELFKKYTWFFYYYKNR